MSSRKYESGYQKRQKKQRLEKLTQFQRGAMDRFIVKESEGSNNQALNQGPVLESGLLEKIEYESIIEDFISKSTIRMKLFKS